MANADTIIFISGRAIRSAEHRQTVQPEEETISTRAYLMSMFSADGRFDKALAALSRSYVELDLLPGEPKDMPKLYTEEFLSK